MTEEWLKLDWASGGQVDQVLTWARSHVIGLICHQQNKSFASRHNDIRTAMIHPEHQQRSAGISQVGAPVVQRDACVSEPS